MDLGIAGRRALICGSSAGLGLACATALAEAGATVTMNGRDAQKLAAAAALVEAAAGRRPHHVAADVTTTEGRERLLAETGEVDILVTNAGGPPAGDFRSFSEAQWQQAFENNALSAIMLIRGTVDGMIDRKWGRIINITSAAVKAPIAPLALSNTARMALTGFVAGLSRDIAKHGVTVNNLLPGPFATDRLRGFARQTAQAQGREGDAVMAEMAAEVPAGRIGDPQEFGAWCAFLASRHGAYMTGQNLLLDGGSYRGTL